LELFLLPILFLDKAVIFGLEIFCPCGILLPGVFCANGQIVNKRADWVNVIFSYCFYNEAGCRTIAETTIDIILLN
jgi:hypothetical protein